MRIFLSWSGKRSEQLASALHQWLPMVLQASRPYFSAEDIAKGARWSADVFAELQNTNVGVLCLTAENMEAPWLLFEAGVLSKALGTSRVMPFLLDVDPSSLTGPLAQFQAVRCNRDEVFKMIRSINAELGQGSLEASVLASIFDKWWPDLERALAKISAVSATRVTKPDRSEREMLSELVLLAREISAALPRQRSVFVAYQEIAKSGVELLNLRTETVAALNAGGISTLEDLSRISEEELLAIPSMSPPMVHEIRAELERRGAHLVRKLPNGVSLPHSR